MRILVISQYFWPENFRINDLTKELVDRGHKVTVLTGIPNYPSGRFFDGYSWFRRTHEKYAEADVVRVPLISRGSGGKISLTLNYISFAVFASVLGPLRLSRNFDVIFVHEPSPITVGLPAIVMKWLTGAPIVFWVLDLWPDSVAATGAARSPWVLRWLIRLVRYIYRRCDQILVSSRSFAPGVVAAGGAQDRVHYFPNWAESLFQPLSRSIPAPRALPDGFRVIFAGNVGDAQDFPSILRAAEMLMHHTDLHWIVLGDGRMFSWAKDEVIKRGLTHCVHLFGQFPVETMPLFFSHADAMLISLKKDAVFSLTVPAKLQAYLACGRPILCMLDGEGARIVREAGAGLCCPAQDPVQLACSVETLMQMSASDREKYGSNGLQYSSREFSRGVLLDRLEQRLTEIAKKRMQASPNTH